MSNNRTRQPAKPGWIEDAPSEDADHSLEKIEQAIVRKKEVNSIIKDRYHTDMEACERKRHSAKKCYAKHKKKIRATKHDLVFLDGKKVAEEKISEIHDINENPVRDIEAWKNLKGKKRFDIFVDNQQVFTNTDRYAYRYKYGLTRPYTRVNEVVEYDNSNKAAVQPLAIYNNPLAQNFLFIQPEAVKKTEPISEPENDLAEAEKFMDSILNF